MSQMFNFRYMAKNTALLILLLILTLPSIGQVNDRDIHVQVLETGIKNSTFIFGKWNKKGGVETQLTYLGNVKTNRGKKLRVLNSVSLWGLSPELLRSF